jgi:transposase
VETIAAQTGGKADRDLVHGRSADRPEEQDHSALGQARHAALRPARSTNRVAYIFGAICPAEGKSAGLVLPSCNTEAMALHLEEIATAVAPGAHAILVLDQAGWHVSKTLPVPPNITLVPLPAKSPELNPVENIWQFMRDNWLSNRVFSSYEDILDHCCFAWNKLIDQPWKIISIGTREWVYGSSST